MEKLRQIASEWINEANEVQRDLSKTLMIVSGTLMVFSTALPNSLANDIQAYHLPIYRISWILILLSLICGIFYLLLYSNRLRNDSRQVALGKLGKNLLRSQTGSLEAVSTPSALEKWLARLQPTLLVSGLTIIGIAVLW